jgi:ABC-type glycerol-3-phosphate transport system substrate-binding protein
MAAIALVAAFVVAACGGGKEEGPTPPSGALSGDLEIFSWWTTGGEAAGLQAMYDLYPKACSPDVKIVNATVAAEDRTFWTNDGIDYAATVRAALANQMINHRGSEFKALLGQVRSRLGRRLATAGPISSMRR